MHDHLLDLAESDRRLTAELGEGHPRVQDLREANARELELVVDEDGWPIPAEAGDEISRAALRIAIHATTRPALQRRCLTMMKTAARHGELPLEHMAEMEGAMAG
ncbi:MAG: hypothetical protein H7Y60_14510 [Rhodospirillaceae bacterium]|nr:hypothetical protein [Rhodospirillales bacterium]